MTVPAKTTPAATPTPAPAPDAIVHSDPPRHLSVDEIAKAVARHKREHPQATPRPMPSNRPVPQKTTPRG